MLIGFSRAPWPSGGGLLGKATTPGTATISGAIDLAISCWVRSRSPHGVSRRDDAALRDGGIAGDREHAVGLRHLQRDLLELLGVGVAVFDGGALGPAEHGEDVALVLDRRELALQGVEQEIARAGHGEPDQQHDRTHRERALEQSRDSRR